MKKLLSDKDLDEDDIFTARTVIDDEKKKQQKYQNAVDILNDEIVQKRDEFDELIEQRYDIIGEKNSRQQHLHRLQKQAEQLNKAIDDQNKSPTASDDGNDDSHSHHSHGPKLPPIKSKEEMEEELA